MVNSAWAQKEVVFAVDATWPPMELAFRVRKAGDAGHASGEEQVLKIVEFVYNQRVHAEHLVGDGLARVFCHLLLLEQTPLEGTFGAFDALDGGCHRLFLLRLSLEFPQMLFQLIDLLLDEGDFGFIAHRQQLENAVRHQDQIPFAGGDAREKRSAFGLREITCFDGQDARGGVGLECLGFPLAHDRVGHNGQVPVAVTDCRPFSAVSGVSSACSAYPRGVVGVGLARNY